MMMIIIMRRHQADGVYSALRTFVPVIIITIIIIVIIIILPQHALPLC